MIVLNDGIAIFESNVYAVLSQHMTPDLTKVMIVITNMGSANAIITITIVLLALPLTRRIFGLPVAVTVTWSTFLNSVLKLAISRNRPNILWLITETGYGFPSGHAMSNAALYTIILLITFRQTENIKIRVFVLLFALTAPFCIGISRIYLGVHYAGDVLAGWILGISLGLLVDTLWYENFNCRI